MIGIKKKCPRCNGLGITYFYLEGDIICKLCKGKRKIWSWKRDD